eukprot:783109-Prymnesium_polylepis.1
MYLWCFCARAGICRQLKIALKAPLKKAPLFGWAMQAFQFVFLSRSNREADVDCLQRTLAHSAADDAPLALLIFPEGTDLSPANAAKSDEHARAAGLSAYTQVLHPRTAGFLATVDALGGRLGAVYDLTVEYDNHPSVAASADPRPSEGALLRGANPRAVHVLAERFERSALPV